MPKSPSKKTVLFAALGIVAALALVALEFLFSISSRVIPGNGVRPPGTGDKAREFALDTLDGRTISLPDLLKSGPAILVVLRGWVGYQCPICTQQVGDLLAHAMDFKENHARVVFVYPGAASSLKEHAQDFISGKLLPEGYYFVTDPDAKFTSAWGLRRRGLLEMAYPATFVVDTGATVRYAKISSGHGDRASAAELIAALDAIGARQ